MAWKHCEKEKLLVTSNFSFSHSVFKRLVPQTRENQGLFGKGLMSSKDDIVSYKINVIFFPSIGKTLENIWRLVGCIEV